MTIANLVEATWLTRYPWQIEITHFIGSEFLGREFKNILIQRKYGIKSKLSTSVNPQANVIREITHQVLVKSVQAYNLL